MANIIIVPGLAVRSFVVPAARRLARSGHRVELLPAPAWRGVPDDLAEYGRWLADEVLASADPVDLMIGLSVGTQAAAVAAARSDVRRLLLVSPTVEPSRRSRGRLLGSWLRGDDHPDSPSLRQQAPDWARAGARRIYRGMMSAIGLRLEDVLDGVSAELTMTHSGWDNLTSYDFAAALAADHGGRILELPEAPHSWPIGDEERFVTLVDALLAGDGPDD